ncbi:hypothetical protein NUITMVS1_44570 (plasmid) [Shewanella xiamenensis]|nr:hypothetical protein NUITMVS1_44570 [Shewanella xiamenensis]
MVTPDTAKAFNDHADCASISSAIADLLKVKSRILNPTFFYDYIGYQNYING